MTKVETEIQWDTSSFIRDAQWAEFCRQIYAFLTSEGFNVSEGRIPFTYHHDLVRQLPYITEVNHISMSFQSNHISRADVAQCMSEFRGRYGDRAYWLATIYGALLFIFQNHPNKTSTMISGEGELMKFMRACEKELKDNGITQRERWF